jgi:hypothetical protein
MREIETVVIGGIEEFLQEMVPQLGFQRMPVYRGQASSEWKLFPPLFREEVAKTEFKSWSELESAFLIGLKQRGRGELGYEPSTELEWLAQGAHHGLPTRFSNWTENALVALFFATDPSQPGEDGAVWRIMPGDSSLLISQDYEQIPEQARLYRPQRPNAAMFNQKTCFLSHPLPKEDASAESFEDLFELGSERISLAKLIIRAGEKAFLRRRLATMGVDHRAMFPGMSGLCRDVREELYSHTDSYEWIFPE